MVSRAKQDLMVVHNIVGINRSEIFIITPNKISPVLIILPSMIDSESGSPIHLGAIDKVFTATFPVSSISYSRLNSIKK